MPRCGYLNLLANFLNAAAQATLAFGSRSKWGGTSPKSGPSIRRARITRCVCGSAIAADLRHVHHGDDGQIVLQHELVARECAVQFPVLVTAGSGVKPKRHDDRHIVLVTPRLRLEMIAQCPDIAIRVRRTSWQQDVVKVGGGSRTGRALDRVKPSHCKAMRSVDLAAMVPVGDTVRNVSDGRGSAVILPRWRSVAEVDVNQCPRTNSARNISLASSDRTRSRSTSPPRRRCNAPLTNSKTGPALRVDTKQMSPSGVAASVKSWCQSNHHS